MANNLTGDFEAVVQVSVRQINGLLATLHQNGASEDAPLKLQHSVAMRVGDVRKKPPDVTVFGDWVLEYQRARESGGLNSAHEHLVEYAPPGAAKLIEAAFDKLDDILETPPIIVRGAARMQLSSPTLSLPAGSTSEVTLHAWVRAHYTPDPGTTDLPQPIHGEVHATFEVRVQPRLHPFRGRQELLIQPSAQDGKILFYAAPGSGLSATDVAAISAQVRKAVREGFTTLPVGLPGDFPFTQFKAVGSGPGQAVALPINLSSASAPTGNIQSITNWFIGASGFAFAVSKEYVGGLLQTFLDSIKIAPSIRVLGINIPISFSLAPLSWAPGKVTVSGRVEFHNPGPNQWITFSQALTLELDVGAQSVALKPVGEPAVDESFFISHSTAVNGVRGARDSALAAGAAPINDALSNARRRLNEALRSFDHSASARFTMVEITPDGVIVRGEIDSTAARLAPVIDIAETQQGQAFTALKSWIPGGRIEQLTWSWVEYPGHATVWTGVLKSVTDAHRFIFPKPAAATSLSSICLRVEGTQITPTGHVVSAVGGTTCSVPGLSELMEVPSWWEPVTVPLWLPDSTADAVLNDIIAGHVSVQSNTPREKQLTHNSLVYFADWRADKPLEPLVRALNRMRRKQASLVVIVVLPAGTFKSRRREVEARLDSIGERFPALLLPTEDSEGGWTRTFAVSKTPSAHLINARRKFVWKHEGEADPEVLAAALDEYLLAAPAPRLRPLRLTVSPGERAPDVFFQEHRGEQFALHRLRGQELLLNFWQAWSAPCITELGRLQRLHRHVGERGPFIVAFHGGKDAKVLDEIRRRHDLSFPLVQDDGQRIARKYGIRCWPTTVSVNADRFVDHVQFGITHPHFADGQTGESLLSRSP